MNMYNTAIETIKKYNLLTMGDKVVAALSGGADSMALLFFLLEIKQLYGLQVFALHVNHMIRGDEAERDMNFVKEYCAQRKIEVSTYCKDVKELSAKEKISVEEAGRAARRIAYDEALNKFSANKIALAHNKNDQAETFLLRLIRGAGPKGLSCMDYENGCIIRPLLDCGRGLIEEYIKKNKIPYVNDSTNQLEIYDRNKIRLNVLPWIENNLNPNIVNTLANTAALFKEQSSLLVGLSEKAYTDCLMSESDKEIIFNNKIFLEQEEAVKKLVIRLALEKINVGLKDITAKHVNNVIELAKKGTGKRSPIKWDIVCERSYETIIIKRESVNISYSYNLELNRLVYIEEIKKYAVLNDNDNFINNDLKYICTKMFKCDKIISKVCLRTRLPGDFIKLTGGAKKLKKYFIDNKIPRNERNAPCLIVADNQVISVLGIIDGITEGKYDYYVKIWEDTNG